MGLTLTRPVESPHISPPLFRNIFTDITGPIGHQVSGPCVKLNLRFLDCIDAYGTVMGKEKCKLLWQDFAECDGQWKQLRRVEDMKAERSRQYFLGLIGRGEKVEHRSKNVPDYDTFLPDFDISEA